MLTEDTVNAAKELLKNSAEYNVYAGHDAENPVSGDRIAILRGLVKVGSFELTPSQYASAYKRYEMEQSWAHHVLRSMYFTICDMSVSAQEKFVSTFLTATEETRVDQDLLRNRLAFYLKSLKDIAYLEEGSDVESGTET